MRPVLFAGAIIASGVLYAVCQPTDAGLAVGAAPSCHGGPPMAPVYAPAAPSCTQPHFAVPAPQAAPVCTPPRQIQLPPKQVQLPPKQMTVEVPGDVITVPGETITVPGEQLMPQAAPVCPDCAPQMAPAFAPVYAAPGCAPACGPSQVTVKHIGPLRAIRAARAERIAARKNVSLGMVEE